MNESPWKSRTTQSKEGGGKGGKVCSFDFHGYYVSSGLPTEIFVPGTSLQATVAPKKFGVLEKEADGRHTFVALEVSRDETVARTCARLDTSMPTFDVTPSMKQHQSLIVLLEGNEQSQR